MTDTRPTTAWRVAPEPVDGAAAQAVLRAYYRDIVDRYHRAHHGRAATDAEVAEALRDEPSDTLAPPHGVYLLARPAGGGPPAGCAGVRLLEPGTAELARVWVAGPARRAGLGGLLVAAAERAARDTLGARRVRLDTRADLTEARALYAGRGYAEIAAYHDGPYADHFYEKQLTP